MNIRRTQTLCLMGLLVSISSANAQQFEDAASIAFGGVDIIPTVDLGLRFDDNVTRASSDEISSWSRIVAPQVNVLTSLGASQVILGYRLVNESYFSSQEDNYTDHFFTAGVDLELNARNRLDVKVDFEDGHEARGTGFSIGTSTSLTRPDKYKQSQFDLVYSYGAFNSNGRINVNFNIRELDYDINTDSYRARDRQLTKVGGTFLYRVGANTDATFDLDYTAVDYKFAIDSANVLDSKNSSALVGMKWEASAKTSGFAKIGYQRKNFDSRLREDFSGFDWSAGVIWEPLEYASIELITRNDTNETNGEGNFIRGRTHIVEWRHEWLQRLRSSARIIWNNNRYEGELIDGQQIRSDDNLGLNASVFYQFRRWLNFEATYRFSERESNRATINFDRNQFILNARVTL